MSVASKFWLLILINCIFYIVGTTAGPLLLRFYYLNGGNRNWTISWLQVAGFPILLVPITVSYLRKRSSGVKFLASSPKLLMYSVAIGLISGLNSFIYSYGLSYLPLSTSQLLSSTQLAFTAFFAFFIVREKFTAYKINAIVLMTMGSIMLGLMKSADRPPSVTSAEYSFGFFMTLAAAGLFGFTLTCSEFVCTKTNEAITYSGMLQFLLWVNFFSAVFCTLAMLINRDFLEIPREASEFRLGATKYYILLASTSLIWQMALLGTYGLLFCTSSIFVGVLGAALLPLTELLGAILFHEKFTGEKGMSLALCVWGFTSYFYGSYKGNKKQKPSSPLEIECT